LEACSEKENNIKIEHDLLNKKYENLIEKNAKYKAKRSRLLVSSFRGKLEAADVRMA
jgi:hypothetical protein